MQLDELTQGGSEGALVALPPPAAGVQLWSCALARPEDEVRALAQLLSPAETARAGRFGTDILRDRYIVGRATLRLLLGRRLTLDPARVIIKRGPRGRPFAAHAGELDFNVSHTDGLALIGITVGQRIGVDIEHAERRVNVEGVARKFMTPNERDALAALAANARRVALLQLWTCKEAMSKATGDALSAPFRAIDIAAGVRPQLLAGPLPYTPGAWALHAMTVRGHYLATVALWQGDSRHG